MVGFDIFAYVSVEFFTRSVKNSNENFSNLQNEFVCRIEPFDLLFGKQKHQIKG